MGRKMKYKKGHEFFKQVEGSKTNILGGTYHTWADMKYRCFTKSCKKYPDYGGRGITVCERWLNFKNFLEDMGEKPAGLSIDRINNDGNYEPGNCRWATSKEQVANQRPRTKKAA